MLGNKKTAENPNPTGTESLGGTTLVNVTVLLACQHFDRTVLCDIRSFLFNAENTLHFHEAAPGPVLYCRTKTLTTRLFSEVCRYLLFPFFACYHCDSTRFPLLCQESGLPDL